MSSRVVFSRRTAALATVLRATRTATIRRRLPSALLSLLALAIGILLVAAAVHGWAAPSGDCNNEIGQCIRGRQRIAIEGIALIYTIAGLGMVGVGVGVATGLASKITTIQIVLTALGALLILAFFVIDPVGHLNNSFTGWLAAAPPHATAT
jgi:uncharacterized membrane protein YphA (DoxX/SURF4 family)